MQGEQALAEWRRPCTIARCGITSAERNSAQVLDA